MRGEPQCQANLSVVRLHDPCGCGGRDAGLPGRLRRALGWPLLALLLQLVVQLEHRLAVLAHRLAELLALPTLQQQNPDGLHLLVDPGKQQLCSSSLPCIRKLTVLRCSHLQVTQAALQSAHHIRLRRGCLIRIVLPGSSCRVRHPSLWARYIMSGLLWTLGVHGCGSPRQW